MKRARLVTLSDDEILEALEQYGNISSAAAEAFHCSKSGLRYQMEIRGITWKAITSTTTKQGHSQFMSRQQKQKLSEAAYKRYGYGGPDDAIKMIKDAAELLGRPPLAKDLKHLDKYPSRYTFAERFGSWTNALKMAGFEPNKRKPTVSPESEMTDAEMLDNLRELSTRLGRRPLYNDLPYSSGTEYGKRFGTWSNALRLAGFNPKSSPFHKPQKPKEHKSKPKREPKIKPARVARLPLEQREYKNITPRLRFAVLARDNFRCVYCGRQSTTHMLVVDHLVPASKGGKTTYKNLVTSCELCNSGKGNTWTGMLPDGYSTDK